ncbi:MAG: hypothetical protein LBJ80_00180 [Rickettsiales bacterium]|jgi:hypothetical protein|nr:hypothetical protein [Rickettsiales bacterium]
MAKITPSTIRKDMESLLKNLAKVIKETEELIDKHKEFLKAYKKEGGIMFI